MQTIQPGQNTGVIITPVQDTDLHVGALTPTLINASGDWRAYECDGEWQKDMTINFDTEACMSFTPANIISTYLNWLINTNQILPAQLQFLQQNGYIGSDGKVQISPRYIAKMSNTTVDGNDFQNVWNAIKAFGVVPDSLWPMPVAQMNADPAQAWALYYANIPQSVVEAGQKFLQFFSVDWEWLVSDGSGATQEQFQEWLQVAPIHLAIQVCPPWNTEAPIPGCGTGAQHGVQLSRVEVGVVNNILDHYVPFDKQLEANYTLSYAVRGLVTQIPQAVVNATVNATVTPAQTVQESIPQVQQAIDNLKNLSPVVEQEHISKIQSWINDLKSLIGMS